MRYDGFSTVMEFSAMDLSRLETNAQELVRLAKHAGADACDVVVAKSASESVQIRDGQVENTGRAESDDLYLRVFCGKQVASVSANQMQDFSQLAERAVAMARVSPENPFEGLADPDKLARDIPRLEMFDAARPEPDVLNRMAREAESAGLAVPGIDKSMGASAGYGITGFVLATSTGFSSNFARTGYSLSAVMLSGEGEKMERDYEFSSSVFFDDLADAATVGRIAGERAANRANPRRVASGKHPVVFDRRISGGLLGAALSAANGSSVARKTSFWREMLGTQVAAPAITVHDNPLMDRRAGSRPFDGEGLAGEPMEIISEGELKSWLLDGATARELGTDSNARASRSGAGTSPSSTNAWIAAGKKSLDNILKEIGTGLYVTETIGHGVNMVTGDYSKGASGFWIENGEIAFPVAEITIAGNLNEMFLNMTPASDLEFRGAVNAPSLLVDGLTIGGE